jgi:hypothetical protein
MRATFTLGSEVDEARLVRMQRESIPSKPFPQHFVVTQPAMFYVTGGVAVTDLKYSEQFSDNQAGFLATEGASISQIKAGWTAGAGIESVLSSNWTAKFEYLYADFGSVSANDTLSTISRVLAETPSIIRPIFAATSSESV